MLLTEGSNYANYEVRQSVMLHGDPQELLTRTKSVRRTLDAISFIVVGPSCSDKPKLISHVVLSFFPLS